MSSQIVLDASFMGTMVLSRPASHITRSLWRDWRVRGIGLCAPSLLLLEVGTTIRKYVYASTITEESANESLAVFQSLVQQMTLAPLEELLSGAWDIARRYRLINLYDASYVALADQRGCDIWTLDGRMRRAMPGHASRIHVLSAEV